MPINDTIKKLDELREKVGKASTTFNHDWLTMEQQLYLKGLVDSYESLRKAALAGEELAKAVENLRGFVCDTCQDETRRKSPNLSELYLEGRCYQWSKQRDAALATYRKAIEE